jgi:hypothetical protein
MVKSLREADKSPVAEVAKKHGVRVTIYAWCKRFGQLEAACRRALKFHGSSASSASTVVAVGDCSNTKLRYAKDSMSLARAARVSLPPLYRTAEGRQRRSLRIPLALEHHTRQITPIP